MKIKFISKTAIIVFLFTAFLLQSCSYTFTGASIPPAMKTVSIPLFENQALLVVPNLALKLTEAFKDRVRNQSSLNITRSEADGNFEGKITEYSTKPVSVQDNTKAGQERLNITVSIKYTSTLEPKSSFETSFTRFADYSLNAGTFQSQQQALNDIIIKQLTEDIFNKAFANW